VLRASAFSTFKQTSGLLKGENPATRVAGFFFLNAELALSESELFIAQNT
jgi:hypothetical protein